MPSFDSGVEDVCVDFHHFVRAKTSVDSGYLVDYIDEWLESEDDDAVTCVHGDYTLYLQVILAIIEKVYSDPEFLVDEDGRARRIRGLASPKPHTASISSISNRHLFESIRFKLLIK